MINKFLNKTPDTDKANFIAWNADVSGDVVLGAESSVWFSATIRGDIAPIRIGNSTNIQDGAVCHISVDRQLTVGDWVTVGHNAIIHSCTIGNHCLIGMGAIVLDKAEIGDYSIVGAGSLVTGGKKFPPRSLILGSPAKVVRELTDEDIKEIDAAAERYRIHSKETAEERKVK
ncbi:MAG: gamma carbonic anhydrase family protein [Spirochaetales bacterium]|uniref:Gamma carbonic anhydrase family protein n=1 Tax=Candidatus Thalassospirochaeta sargassi TaxID=3119039 RepID=A0AAJ1IDL3_9SPIO|nr:gamma carbonic anhydrase family protein [Spirochaetales bacterium]